MNYHFKLSAAQCSGSPQHLAPEYAGLMLQSLYSAEVERDATLQLLRLVLQPGEAVPLHRNDRSEAVYLQSGRVTVRRGAGAVELDAPSAAYLPAGVPHAIINTGQEVAVLLISVSRMWRPLASWGEMLTETADVADANTNPNEIRGSDPRFRWAVHESFEPWVPVEPSKGWRLKMKFLLDPDRGAPDFVSGLAVITAGTHYTLHRHAPAEFYHVLDGQAKIHVGADVYDVTAGDTVYVPENVVHGIDGGNSDLLVHWIYAVEGRGTDWVWAAVEDIYTDTRT